jgi:hypothetical protein
MPKSTSGRFIIDIEYDLCLVSAPGYIVFDLPKFQRGFDECTHDEPAPWVEE